MNSRLFLVVVSAWLLATPAAEACIVPVFRYALERWSADPYTVLVFHKGPLTAGQQQLVTALRRSGDGNHGFANLSVETVDLAADVEKGRQAIWQAQKSPTLPWVVARYPESEPDWPSAWSGPLTETAVRTLVDSPARRQISRSILKGDSVVWVLVESGDRTEDETAAGTLATELKKLEKELPLPEIDPDDSRLRTNLPLKLAFSVVRVSRQDPAEQAFLSLLVNSEQELAGAKGPLVFPVFGRGRTLSPLVGKEIAPDPLLDVGHFLAGSCSCEVKRLNPGTDLLLAADWDALLEQREVKETDFPVLVGLSQPDKPPSPTPPTKEPTPAEAEGRSLPPADAPQPGPAEAEGRAETKQGPAPQVGTPAAQANPVLVRNLVLALGGGVIVLALATVLLQRKARKV